MYVHDEQQIADLTVRVVLDEHVSDLDNPRDRSNLGTMYCAHRRYNLGDEQVKSADDLKRRLVTDAIGWDEWATYCDWNDEIYYQQQYRKHHDPDIEGWDSRAHNLAYADCEEHMEEKIQRVLDEHYFLLPLFLYDHSGITMNTSGFYSPWDSGQVGVIAVLKETVLDEMDWKRISKQRAEKVYQWLREEVEIYDQYLRGEIYGFRVETEDGDVLDSCWGYFDADYCMTEGVSAAKHIAQDEKVVA